MFSFFNLSSTDLLLGIELDEELFNDFEVMAFILLNTFEDDEELSFESDEGDTLLCGI